VVGGGFHNKGAEAMLLTVASCLKERFPSVTVLHYAVHDTWRERLREAGVAALAKPASVPGVVRRWEELRARLSGAPLLGKRWRPESHGGIEAVLDVSGFRSSDQRGASVSRGRWWQMHRLWAPGVPIVYLPQAWGPFQDRAVRRYTRSMLREASLVYARDKNSLGYLQELGAVSPERLGMAADIAFHFRPAPPDCGERILAGIGARGRSGPLVGIAPNVRIYELADGEGTQNEYVRLLARVCEYFLRDAGADVAIIPHEVYENETRDDLIFGELLRDVLGRPDGLHAVTRNHSAADLKSLVGQLDFLVASRYHSLVAGLSMRVPLVVLGWSHKYVELMNDVDLGEYAVHLPAPAESCLDLVRRAWAERASLRDRVAAGVPRMEDSAGQALDRAVALIEQSARTPPKRPAARRSRPAARWDSVEPIVASNLCTGCGTCAAVCPSHAISITEAPSGFLEARVDAEKCTACGLCVQVCPGWQLRTEAPPPTEDPFRGRILGAFLAQATSPELLADAQSGGAATAVLLHLMGTGRVDGAIVVGASEENPLRPTATIARRPEDLFRARGSKYCPVTVSDALADGARGRDRLALVGVACQVHGVRNAQVTGHLKQVGFVVGLMCSGMSSYRQMDYLLSRAGVRGGDVTYFRHKHKSWLGWPGDVLVRTRGGKEYHVLRRVFAQSRVPFGPPCCRLCFDHLNVLSDISVGDAHLLARDRRGVSLVLARTEQGLDALRGAAAAGLLKPLKEVSIHDACTGSQSMESRRDEWTAYYTTWRRSGRPAPDFGIARHWYGSVGALSRAAYAWKLRDAIRLANAPTEEEALAAAVRSLRLDRVRAAFRPRTMLRSVKGSLAASARRFLGGLRRGATGEVPS